MHWLTVIVIVLAASYAVIGTFTRSVRGDTVNSRLATVHALTSEGSFYVRADDPFLANTVDKVRVNGRYMSSKPPVLPLFMTVEYLVARGLSGWSLQDEDQVDRLVRLYTLTFVGLPYVLMLVLVGRIASWYIDAPVAQAYPVTALAFGTQAGGYATIFNNHVLPAAMLAACLYLAIQLLIRNVPGTRSRMAFFGVASSLAVTVDLPSVFIVAPLAILILIQFPRQALTIAAPIAAIPLLAQTAVYVRYTGSPLPVQLNASNFLFESSYWRVPRGADAMAEPHLTYLFHMTLGRNGLFSLFPVTAIGLIGALIALRTDSWNWKRFAACVVAGLVLLTAYYAYSTNNYGGVAFGFRWFIIAAPVLMILAIPAVARARSPLVWAVMAALLAVSIWSSYQCYRHPWSVDREWTTRIFGPRL